MPSKPQPKLQIGSPRARRTVLDDVTFDELSGRTNEPPSTDGSDARSVSAAKHGSAEITSAALTRSAQRERKGKKGDPYVRKTDGVRTVPQYLTLPADVVKRLKLYAVEHDKRISDIASEAISQYLDREG